MLPDDCRLMVVLLVPVMLTEAPAVMVVVLAFCSEIGALPVTLNVVLAKLDTELAESAKLSVWLPAPVRNTEPADELAVTVTLAVEVSIVIAFDAVVPTPVLPLRAIVLLFSPEDAPDCVMLPPVDASEMPLVAVTEKPPLRTMLLAVEKLNAKPLGAAGPSASDGPASPLAPVMKTCPPAWACAVPPPRTSGCVLLPILAEVELVSAVRK